MCEGEMLKVGKNMAWDAFGGSRAQGHRTQVQGFNGSQNQA